MHTLYWLQSSTAQRSSQDSDTPNTLFAFSSPKETWHLVFSALFSRPSISSAFPGDCLSPLCGFHYAPVRQLPQFFLATRRHCFTLPTFQNLGTVHWVLSVRSIPKSLFCRVASHIAYSLAQQRSWLVFPLLLVSLPVCSTATAFSKYPW
jgi:hypothetical protein